eukprot:jgi/Psemu1/230495/e_gw1.3235.6.1
MNYRDGSDNGNDSDNGSGNETEIVATLTTYEYEDAPVNQGLLSGKRKTIHPHYQHQYRHRHRHKTTIADADVHAHAHAHADVDADPGEWMRPYWLGSGLFLILFAFWLLDSLKDPIFVGLVDGKISKHQPTAKLCSVGVTLVLVCLLEFWTHRRQEQQRAARLLVETTITPDDDVLDPGGVWKRIQMKSKALGGGGAAAAAGKGGGKYSNSERDSELPEQAPDDTVSFEIFYYVGVPYLVAFSILSYYTATTTTTTSDGTVTAENENPLGYYVLGYVLYATVESFGSLAVATFWSYTNSTLSLRDAEKYYGPIIATAQLGAIGGSTIVATGRWDSSSLLTVVALAIALQLLLMRGYDRRFQPTSLLVAEQHSHQSHSHSDGNATLTKPFWSGLYLIFSHSYVLLILGVSCLYEVAMTLLDYQMKLLGVARFHDAAGTTAGAGIDVADADASSMSFSTFMGHYGQVVNVTSLVFSSLLFPFLIRRLGLRRTLLWFPTMLLVVTFLAYGAMPGNLAVLFVSLSLLKAMTYSIHDPSKELLYIPTSNAVKFRAKFWIDVVGERISKAIGSAFNTMAKNVEQSVRIGTIPSLLTALGLWMACYSVGLRFDGLLATGKIVGLEHSIDPSTYSRVPQNETDDNNEHDNKHEDDNEHDDKYFYDRNYDYHSRYIYNDEPSEVEINFLEEDAVSTLDLMVDPTTTSSERRRIQEDVEIIRGIEMPRFKRI